MCAVCEMRDFAAGRLRRAGIVPMLSVALATLALHGDRAEASPAGNCIVVASQASGVIASPLQFAIR